MMCGKKLKDLRHRCAFNTAEVADALGISEDDVIAIENNKKPITTTMLDRFCSLYGCDNSYIFGDENSYCNTSNTVKFVEGGVDLENIMIINKVLANLNFLRNL